jgi:hypothetical protein
MIESITIERLETLADEPPEGRVPWSDHDKMIVAKYYGRGAVTCDDLREHFDCKDRTDVAIGVMASRLGVTRGRA